MENEKLVPTEPPLTEAEDAIAGEIVDSPALSTALEKLPPEIRREVLMFIQQTRMGPSLNPLAEKITKEHISSMIENAEKGSVRAHKSQWFNLAYIVLCLAFLVFIFIYLPTIDKALFEQIIKVLIVFAGGVGTGLGVSKYRQSND